MNRKTARENAFILIFERCFREDSVESIIEDAIEAREFEYDDYVETVFKHFERFGDFHFVEVCHYAHARIF